MEKIVSRNFSAISESLINIRKTIAAQDKVIANLRNTLTQQQTVIEQMRISQAHFAACRPLGPTSG